MLSFKGRLGKAQTKCTKEELGDITVICNNNFLTYKVSVVVVDILFLDTVLRLSDCRQYVTSKF
jgi:hypothetical protein